MEIEYKTIDEQINLIKSKNILIKDEEKAKKILLKTGYYNLITEYKDIFIDIKASKKTGIETCDQETYFEEIYSIYTFDRDLRSLMLKYISIVETHIKSYISEIISKKYGTKNYLIKENFNVNSKNEGEYQKLIDAINGNFKRNIDNYEDIKKCYEQNKAIPFWMLSTLLTFGNIVKFYSFMKNEDKTSMAEILDMKPNEIKNYLAMLNIVRNVSAHNNVLFNIRMKRSYFAESGKNYHDLLGIGRKGYSYTSGVKDIMSIIIILRRFLDNREYSHLVMEFIQLVEDVKEDVDEDSFESFLETIGIPKNYNIIKSI